VASWYLARLIRMKIEVICSSETSVEFQLNFSGIRGVISQKTVLFITTALSTSRATELSHHKSLDVIVVPNATLCNVTES
jgi:hypothetical protein